MAGVTSENMKKYGRNIARAMNQTGGSGVGKKTGTPYKVVDGYDMKPEADKGIRNAPDQAVVANEGSPEEGHEDSGHGGGH